jgi:SH3-like domain-containing protein
VIGMCYLERGRPVMVLARWVPRWRAAERADPTSGWLQSRAAIPRVAEADARRGLQDKQMTIRERGMPQQAVRIVFRWYASKAG